MGFRNEQGQRDGFGVMQVENGPTYTGQWSGSKRDGHGTLFFEKGVFEGQWVQGNAHGKGMVHFKNGDIKEDMSRIESAALGRTPGQMAPLKLGSIWMGRSTGNTTGSVEPNDGRCSTTRAPSWAPSVVPAETPAEETRRVPAKRRMSSWHRNWSWIRRDLHQDLHLRQVLPASHARWRRPSRAAVAPTAPSARKASRMRK